MFHHADDELIADGHATIMFDGVHHDLLLERCADATEDEARNMSHAAGLMTTGECTFREWKDAMRSLQNVENRKHAAWERNNGKPQAKTTGELR